MSASAIPATGAGRDANMRRRRALYPTVEVSAREGRAVTQWRTSPVYTTSNAELGTVLIWFRSVSFHRGSAAPVIIQDEPLSATIIPYFFSASRTTRDCPVKPLMS